MKRILATCAGMLLLASFNPTDAHNSYLARSLDRVTSSDLFDQSEKELIQTLPEFFTHACVKQLYFGDTEQRAIRPFVETVSVSLEAFKSIKDKLVQLHERATTQEEKDTVSFVQYLVNMLLEYVPTDMGSNPFITRTDAGLTAEATRRLVLQALFLLNIINTNVSTLIGNINAPCT